MALSGQVNRLQPSGKPEPVQARVRSGTAGHAPQVSGCSADHTEEWHGARL